MNKFPELVHVAFEQDVHGRDEDFLCVYSDGVTAMEAGTRCAIYKRVDEGIVHGPKSFVSKGKK